MNRHMRALGRCSFTKRPGPGPGPWGPSKHVGCRIPGVGRGVAQGTGWGRRRKFSLPLTP